MLVRAPLILNRCCKRFICCSSIVSGSKDLAVAVGVASGRSEYSGGFVLLARSSFSLIVSSDRCMIDARCKGRGARFKL